MIKFLKPIDGMIARWKGFPLGKEICMKSFFLGA
jgi:hypothetical protein